MPDSRHPAVAIGGDESLLRQHFSEVLSDEYRVREADSGESALEMVDVDVDVLLLDRSMVGMSGEAVLHQLRDQGYDLPVAMVTARHPDLNILDLSLDDYLVKPVELDELRETIETLLLR